MRERRAHTKPFGVTKYSAALKSCFTCNNQLQLSAQNNSAPSWTRFTVIP